MITLLQTILILKLNMVLILTKAEQTLMFLYHIEIEKKLILLKMINGQMQIIEDLFLKDLHGLEIHLLTINIHTE